MKYTFRVCALAIAAIADTMLMAVLKHFHADVTDAFTLGAMFGAIWMLAYMAAWKRDGGDAL